MRQPFALALVLSLAYGLALVLFRLLPINDALVFCGLLIGATALLEKSPRRRLGLHLVTQIITVFWVFHLWSAGYEGRSAIFGGILPWSDSFDYLNDALRLIHGHALEFGAKRPLYPVSLAGLLQLFGGNLRLVLLLYAVFGAFSVALAVNAIWDSHGHKAALIVFALLLFSLRHWAGYVQTEAIGLPLGLIGFTLIWCSRADRRLVAAGLLAITMALMARAGAFFILPALALWAILSAPKPQRLAAAAWCLGAIAAGGLVHEGVLHLTASGLSFSDYPAIVYGLIHHKDFTYLAETHPALNTLSGGTKAAAAWAIVRAEIMAQPLALLLGMLRSFLELFYTPNGLFGFVWRNPDDIIFENGPALRQSFSAYGFAGPVVYWVQEKGLYSLCNGIAMAFLGLLFVASVYGGLWALFRRPADPHRRLLRFAIGGVLLSAPFTPPWITGAHQVEVATLAFMALVPALWWSAAKVRPLPQATSRILAFFPPGFALAVLAAAVCFIPIPQTAPATAVPGTPAAMEIYGSTRVRVSLFPGFGEGRAMGDLEASLVYLKKHNLALTQSLAPYLEPGTLYVLGYDPKAGGARILIDDSGRLGQDHWQTITATPLRTPVVLHVTGAAPAGMPPRSVRPR